MKGNILRRFNKVARYSVAGLIAASVAAEAGMEAFYAYPALYSIKPDDWLRDHQLPENLLPDIDNSNIRFLISGPAGDIYAFRKNREIRSKLQSLRLGPSDAVQFIVRQLERVALPADILKAYWDGSMAGRFHTVTYVGDPFIIDIRPDDFSGHVAKQFPLTPDQRAATEMFAIAHELFHTTQRVPYNDIGLLENEGEADSYATRKTLENTGDTHAMDILEDIRLLDAVKGYDEFHATASYIRAARAGLPYPDPRTVLDETREAAGIFHTLEDNGLLGNTIVWAEDGTLGDIFKTVHISPDAAALLTRTLILYGGVLDRIPLPESPPAPSP